MKVPVLGMVENIQQRGGKRTAEAMSIHFLGALPLDPHVRIGGDTGHPVATAGPEDQYGGVYYELAKAVMERAREASSVAGPTMTVSD